MGSRGSITKPYEANQSIQKYSLSTIDRMVVNTVGFNVVLISGILIKTIPCQFSSAGCLDLLVPVVSVPEIY